MKTKLISKIIASGSFLPKKKIDNDYFLKSEFYDVKGQKLNTPQGEIINKFVDITGIQERVYADDKQTNSDLAYLAAKDALDSSGIDKESLDYILVAHNFGDIQSNSVQTDQVPSLAARVKHALQIKNHNTIAHDILFGCPGWIQAMILANSYIKSGEAKRVLVIGSEALSRVCDPYDRDSMIYSDGAGAVILEGQQSDQEDGMIASSCRTDTMDELFYLRFDQSDNKEFAAKNDSKFLKMDGRKIYEYAISKVPALVKECIEKAGLDVSDIKKILIHQANEKMDYAIVKRLFRLYGKREFSLDLMPMMIDKMGNNSVATVPVLFDRIRKGNFEGHSFSKGDYVVFASVGAGMSVNAFVYRF